MAAFGAILILLSFVVGLCAWVGLFAPKVFANRKTGKVYNRAALFFGFSFIATALLIIGALMPPSSEIEAKPKTKTEKSINKSNDGDSQGEASASMKPKSIADAEPQKPDFDFDFDQYKKWVNADLKLIDSAYHIADNVKPDNKDGAVNNVATVFFNENLGLIASVSPRTQKINSLTVMFSPEGETIDILQTVVTASLILSSADGENGNKAIGGKLLKMTSAAIQEFTESGSNGSTKKDMTFNNVEYSIQITKDMPVMMFAEPIK